MTKVYSHGLEYPFIKSFTMCKTPIKLFRGNCTQNYIEFIKYMLHNGLNMGII